MRIPTRIFIADSTVRVSAAKGISALVIASLLAAGAVALDAVRAEAAPGDTANASGQYLSGTLLGASLSAIAGVAGETATSSGTAAQTNSNNLGLNLLGSQIVTLAGGVQIPLALAQAGVVGQYASAGTSGSSVGASGLISSTGAIGTGITPAPGVAPGPLTASLGGIVGSLGLPTATVSEIANLGLTVAPSSATASQTAPGAATSSYQIAGASLTFTSPTVENLVTAATAQVTSLQNLVNGLAGPTGTVAGALNTLGLGGVVSASVTSSNLQAVVNGITGNYTNPAYPGISINLGTGVVTVDLNAITALNGRPANTSILNTTTIATIANRLTGLVLSYGQQVVNGLTTAINGVTLTASVNVVVPVLTINATLGALLAGDTSGISLLGIPLGLLGNVLTALTGPTGPLGIISTTLGALAPALQAPVTLLVAPAVNAVLAAALSVTVNNQSTTAGVFRETGLRATLLPGTSALSLDLASASVGPNLIAPLVPPTLSSLTPTSGPIAGGTSVTITGTGLAGSTGATFGGVAGTAYTVVNNTTATVTTPAHALGPVSVVVQSAAGPSGALNYTYNPVPTITALNPNHGPTAAGTAVTITGTGLIGSTGATFGGTPGTGYTVVNATTATVTAPAHATGVTAVIVQSPNGATGSLPYTFDAAPTISALTPNNGSAAGGTSVTITGIGLTGSTGATFGGTAGTGYAVLNDTTATVVTPAHAAGPVLVAVQSPNGASGSLPFAFNAAPTISALNPNHGPVAGGTVVTITGTGLSAATGASFGGTPGTNFTPINDTTATVTSPAHLAGPTTVTVQSTNGLSGTLPYTYDAPAVITGITPNHGPVGGGTSVTITGTGLTGSTGATFGGAAGGTYAVVNDTTATVSSPASAAGTVSVIVQSPNGGSGALPFTFDPAPAISGLTPNRGPEGGGTFVTITGTALSSASAVFFGTTPAAGFTVVNDTTITVNAPAHTPGAVSVTVQSPNGTSGGLPFTFDPAPVISGLAPNHGPDAGGTTVTITGTNLTGTTGALFGTAPGTGYAVVNDTTATVVSPLHLAQTVSVTVQSPNGTSLGLPFTFDPAPTLLSLTPNHGTTDGGTVVTITGTNLTGTTGVLFGTTPSSFTVDSDTSITVTSPAHAAGAVNVSIQSPNGAAGTLPYIYDQALVPPVVQSLTPNHGPVTGGTSVTITGTGLTGSTAATFDLVDGSDYTVLSDTTATVTSPAHAAGSTTVTVQSPGGTSLSLPYTYDAIVGGAPVVDALTPDHGTSLGGTEVTLTGSGFLGTNGVMFGLNAGTNVQIVDDNTITVDSPAHAPGPVSVVVLSTSGNSTPQGYIFDPLVPIAPAVTGLSPNHGPVNGGSSVTITGIGLTGSTGANFGATPGTAYFVVNDTTATVTVPPHAAGTINVTVLSPNGTSNGSPYIYDAVPPVLTLLAPDNGSAAGGDLITITGSGLLDSTDALFGTTPGIDYTVVSDTEATVESPVHAPGSVSVTVLSPSGNSAGLPYLFTPVPPTVSSLSPATGTAAGGTSVTITGTGLTGATGANFGATPGTAFTVIDDTTATVTSPPGATGAVQVTVLSPNGTSGGSPYLYTVAAPVILSLSPTHGTAAGGTIVTITGTGLTGATGATFGTTQGTVFTPVNSTTVRVTSPAGTAGASLVTVQGPGGSSLALPYLYDPLAPTISSLSPATGTADGGTSVTITGTGFTGATGANFGTTPGAGFTVVSDTSATVTSPVHAAGSVNVTVLSPNGTSTIAPYLYTPSAPIITGLSPAAGTASGGTVVTITGTGLTGATGATFGGTPGISFAVVNDTTATVTSPAGSVGTISLIVQSPNGSSLPLPFLYTTPDFIPVVTALSPSSGSVAGGTLVTITGTGMTAARVAYFDGVAATDLTVLSDTVATARTPASIVPVSRRVALVVQMTSVLTAPMAFDYVDTTTTVVPPVTDLGASGISSGSGGTSVADTETAAIDGSLAFTGQDSAALGFFALLLMLIGTGTVLGRRALNIRNNRTISINRGEQK